MFTASANMWLSAIYFYNFWLLCMPQARFDAVQLGMNTANVDVILGKPLMASLDEARVEAMWDEPGGDIIVVIFDGEGNVIGKDFVKFKGTRWEKTRQLFKDVFDILDKPNPRQSGTTWWIMKMYFP